MRMSALPIAERCGASHRLGEKFGSSSRAAVMSQAAHAMWLEPKKAGRKLAALTEEEREEVLTWHKPEPFQVQIDEANITLRIEDAYTEFPVNLDESGNLVTDSSEPFLTGHPDAFWVVAPPGGPRVGYLADLKKCDYTATVDSLQLEAYAIACSERWKLDSIATGIWYLETGGWDWGPMRDVLELDWPRVKAAAEQPDERRPGAWCRSCFSRSFCPSHLIDPAKGNAELAKYEASELTPERWADYQLMKARIKSAMERIDAAGKLLADQIGGIPDGKGKVYKAVQRKGTERSVKPAQLREELGEEAERFIVRGSPTVAYQWVKA